MQFLYSKWRELDISTRIRIANDFGIKKVGPTHVRDNIIESDGYVIKDIEEAINIDALQKKFESNETDMAILWDWLLNGKPNPPELVITPLPVTKPKRAKKNK